jgi:predicted alpha-1,2-mannosidase
MTNKIEKISIFGLIILLVLSMITTETECQTVSTYTKYVNPFIGTAPLTDSKIIGYNPPKGWRVWAGLTYPGSTLPNAMVQLTPVTAYHTGSGYQYEDTIIYGFAHTCKGHWNLCNIPILPVSDADNLTDKFGSRFSHKTESASPAYYHVFLNDYKVDVKLTSTLRCGYHQYNYKSNQNRQILFDLSKANNKVSSWNIRLVSDEAFEGYQEIGDDKIYFYGKLSRKIEKLEKKRGNTNEGFALVYVSNGGKKLVELKIGLSFVSVKNAKQNLDQEIANKSFEQVQKEGNQIWENLLSKIQIKGGTQKQRELFYSSLYRSFQWPALRSDVNGEYRDVRGKVVKANFNYYTLPSLWDTYRNKLVLLSILSPKVTIDVIKTLQDIGDKTGFIPTFFHGDHAAAFIAGAYQRGLRNFDVKDVYRLLLRNANVEGGTRPYISEYIKKGYISSPQVDSPNVETKGKAGVAKTLEYAFDDYAVARLAMALKDTTNYRILMVRSKNYKNVFDPSTRFMRGRLSNGDWVKNFNPRYPYYEYMYREANAWQVSFFAPQDIPGLVRLYGGKKSFEAKLDSFFTLPWNPEYIARNISCFVGQYCQGNQPDHEAPFLYYFVGKPDKSQKILDTIIENFYGIGEKGLALPGMDDAGEMSAWYVFTSSGLYPYSSADAKYIVTVPIFDEVTWKINNKKVIIKKMGKGRNMKEIIVNGEKNKGYFVPHKLFRRGGTMEIKTEE